MTNFRQSLFIFLFIVSLQWLFYTLFLKSFITTWGAAPNEVIQTMAGDQKYLNIVSTRAILINAPINVVWKCLMGLGADRRGFYSYGFIENALGYQTSESRIKNNVDDLKVGDWVRGSINENSSVVPYNFKVLYVKAFNTLVLQQWGTFLLKKINARQTRLIVRTQASAPSNVWERVGQYVIVPLHYLMERRMLIGIKIAAEKNHSHIYSQRHDVIWFFEIVISWIIMCCLIVIGHGFFQKIVMPIVLGLFWLWALLVINPIIFYSGLLQLAAFAALSIAVIARVRKQLY